MVATLPEIAGRGDDPAALEREHRQQLATECYGMLDTEVRNALAAAPLAAKLVHEGNWKSAARALEDAGKQHDAGLLRLETPIGLEH